MKHINKADLKICEDNLGILFDESTLNLANDMLNIAGSSLLSSGLSVSHSDIGANRTFQVPNDLENKFGQWAIKAQIQTNQDGLIAGKTIAIKDSIAVAGIPMRLGLNVLSRYVPKKDADIVTSILSAGGCIAGKSQCEALCQGAQSISSEPVSVSNPLDRRRSTGGSSSGSAAVVANGDCDMAVGSDSGGSIRIPASFCGLVGMKPTHSLVSFSGAYSIEPSLEDIGPITKNVADNAKLLSVIIKDQFKQLPTSNYFASMSQSAQGLKVGFIQEAFECASTNSEVNHLKQSTQRLIDEAGITSLSISIPEFEHGLQAHLYTYLCSGAKRFAKRTLETREQANSLHQILLSNSSSLPLELKLSLIIGMSLNRSHDYLNYAKQVKAKLTYELNKALTKLDALVLPSTNSIAPLMPSNDRPVIDKLLFSMSADSFAPIFNLTGHPALTIPICRYNEMPMGLTIVTKHFREDVLYKIASHLEKQNS